jgi:hypothetical protein
MHIRKIENVEVYRNIDTIKLKNVTGEQDKKLPGIKTI